MTHPIYLIGCHGVTPLYVIDMVAMDYPFTPMSSLFLEHVYTIGKTLPRGDYVIMTNLYL